MAVIVDTLKNEIFTRTKYHGPEQAFKVMEYLFERYYAWEVILSFADPKEDYAWGAADATFRVRRAFRDNRVVMIGRKKARTLAHFKELLNQRGFLLESDTPEVLVCVTFDCPRAIWTQRRGKELTLYAV